MLGVEPLQFLQNAQKSRAVLASRQPHGNPVSLLNHPVLLHSAPSAGKQSPAAFEIHTHLSFFGIFLRYSTTAGEKNQEHFCFFQA